MLTIRQLHAGSLALDAVHSEVNLEGRLLRLFLFGHTSAYRPSHRCISDQVPVPYSSSACP